jgi:hypothetical protein
MGSVFDYNFKLSLEVFHPVSHQMDVLEHNPVTFFTSLLKSFDCILFLTLSHRNIDEFFICESLSTHLSNKFDFRSWINTREKDEKGWSLRIHFFLSCNNIEWRLFNEFHSHLFTNIILKSIVKSVWSYSS